MRSLFSDPDKVVTLLRDELSKLRVLVVGDLMIDHYLSGSVQRISPEAPVPVVRLDQKTCSPGGAGNVARNLSNLGIHVTLSGLVGDDENGKRLIEDLGKTGVDCSFVLSSPSRPTTSKTRVMGHHQHIARIDEEDSSPITELEELSLLRYLEEAFSRHFDAVILSDYAKGCLTQRICRDIIQISREKDLMILIDPKGDDFSKYEGATAITPNSREASFISRVSGDDPHELMEKLKNLRKELCLDFIVVTRGEKGLSLLGPEGEILDFPARARDVYDVSGAGDTVISVLCAGLAGGLALNDSLNLAQIAAGIVVGKVGTVPVTGEEMLQRLSSGDGIPIRTKIFKKSADLEHQVSLWKDRGESVAFTNGCFDILHAGHVSYLSQAAKLADRLVVAVNTDRSVRINKGEDRPLNGEQDRVSVIASLEGVDGVILFDDPTPIDLIRKLRPHVLIKGNDYREDQVVGAEDVVSWGGRVELVPVLQGRSTTAIIRKIMNK